ncbi:hypothetical protein [Chengkuizengella marina]|uniref:Beta/gamma crystallin 'Greek key' domain-containing protein n=1 Tax=Chengkuizengella marina TaxID=2507566 RepID=A0A6N9Q1P2_9BACL|nr:hypothetical protein [Chengkuizengella marina]NBI28034.1 hypothetical protein [Chengkuizengella marina]
MVMFKRVSLSSFIILSMLLTLIIILSVFTDTKVNAQEREGYEMVDYGTHKVYFPKPTEKVESDTGSLPSNLKSSNLSKNTASNTGEVGSTAGEVSEEMKRSLPELNIEGIRSLSDVPQSTYENRTIHHGLLVDRATSIPVNFSVNKGPYPENEIFLSDLNHALNKKDSNVDTFIGIYNPENGMVTNYFPVNPPDTLTLLLNKDSYYAQGLTLDVEEWWEVAKQGDSNGAKITQSISREIGVDDQKQKSTSITHGTAIGIEWGFKKKSNFLIGEAEWEFKNSIEYNYSKNQTTSFSRTYHSSVTETFTATFGELIDGHPFVWVVYDLVTQTKVNYAQAQNFKELDDDLRNVKDYGLTPHMSSHMVTIKNSIYSVKEIPIFDEDANLAKPNNLTASPDFQNLTITLNWDPVPADQMAQSPVDDDKVNNGKVAGYYVYKNDVIVATIFDPTRTQWIDNKIRPDQNNRYFVRSFSLNEFTSIVLKRVQISTPSNIVYSKVELNDAQLRNMVIGCSIPFAWTDDQIPTGERVYYSIYLGSTKMGDFEGSDASVNISPELYDLLKENLDQSFYITKTVLYNGQPIQSERVSIPNHFTVTKTAFLFDKPNFKGDCVTVSLGVIDNLNQTGYDFDNKLSSMLVQGHIWVQLWPEFNRGGYAQAFFTNEDGLAFVRDFKDTIIGSDTVSSVYVKNHFDNYGGVYLFSGPDFSGTLEPMMFTDDGLHWGMSGKSLNYWFLQDGVSSVKVVGNYALALFENDDYTGNQAIIKEDYGHHNLDRHNLDNKTSSMILFRGEGVWLFEHTNYRGKFKHFAPSHVYNCSWTPNCGFANDTLSSVLVIGDYGIGMFHHYNYNGYMYPTRSHISNMANTGGLGDNAMSSFRIFPKGVYLGDKNHLFVGGAEKFVTTPGEYRSIEHLGFPDNSLSAMFVIGDYRVTLFSDTSFRGSKTVATDGWYDGELSNQAVGENNASSIIIEEY